MNGRCVECSSYVNVPQTRGSRLSEMRCSKCLGTIELVFVVNASKDLYRNKQGAIFRFSWPRFIGDPACIGDNKIAVV